MFLNLHWKHQRPGLFERPSEQFVGSAGLGNAAWVVVGKDDPRSVMPKGHFHDLPGIDACLSQSTPEHLLGHQYPVLGVQEDYDEHLVLDHLQWKSTVAALKNIQLRSDVKLSFAINARDDQFDLPPLAVPTDRQGIPPGLPIPHRGLSE